MLFVVYLEVPVVAVVPVSVGMFVEVWMFVEVCMSVDNGLDLALTGVLYLLHLLLDVVLAE